MLFEVSGPLALSTVNFNEHTNVNARSHSCKSMRSLKVREVSLRICKSCELSRRLHIVYAVHIGYKTKLWIFGFKQLVPGPRGHPLTSLGFHDG